MSQELAWVPAAVAPHIQRLADAIGAHVEATVREAVDRAIAALVAPAPLLDELGIDPRQFTAPAGANIFIDHDRRPDDPLGLERGMAAMDRAVDSMLGPIAQRDPKPDNVSYAEKRGVTPDSYPPTRRAREERTELQANGKKPVTCQKCGFVGGNARGCGTAHETKRQDLGGRILESIAPALEESGRQFRERFSPTSKPMTALAPPRHLKPTAEAVAAAKARIARIAARAPMAPHRVSKPAPERDDNPNADERWSALQIDEERELAENRKHDGELPTTRSSFIVTPRTTGDIGYGGDLGDVEELNFG